MGADITVCEWHDVLAEDALDPELPEPVTAAGRTIALFVIDKKIYATDCHCSHMRARLTDGYVDGEHVECPLHQSRFHIPTGRVLRPPATKNIQTFKTKIEAGRILVHVPSRRR